MIDEAIERGDILPIKLIELESRKVHPVTRIRFDEEAARLEAKGIGYSVRFWHRGGE